MTEERRIVLLGKSGSGKSSLANTILETAKFKTKQSPVSTTKKCESDKKEIHGKIAQLCDTPGFYDTKQTSTELNSEIVKSLIECAPGPHAFLLVLKVEKYTKQEEEVVSEMLKCFSKEAFNYTTVVFTYGDQLNGETTIEEWASENAALMTLIQKCGGRVHVFDNKYWKNSQDPYRNNQYQVRELLKTIDKTVEQNGGRFYTNGFWQRIKNIKIIGIPLHVLLGLILGGIAFAALGAGGAAAANMSVSGVRAIGRGAGLVGGLAGAGAVMALDSEAVGTMVSGAMKVLQIDDDKDKKLQ